MEESPYRVSLFAAGIGCIGFCIWRLREWYRVHSFGLGYIPGPESESHALGNTRQLFQSDVGVMDFQWQEEYGGITRLKGPFGENRLLIGDYKAAHHIVQEYSIEREPARREISRSMVGHGILWAEGDTHKRQRKVLLPAFGTPELRALLPVFKGCSERVTTKWRDILTGSSNSQAVINVSEWLSRATLDVIGEAGFDSSFGALDDTQTEFVKTYRNLVIGAFGAPSKLRLLIVAASPYLPHWLLDLLYDYMPGAGLARARENRRVATKAAKDLVESKIQEIEGGKPGKDILTLLVKANKSFDHANRMSDVELVAQMRTLILVGHETTANTLTFASLELARHPEVQTKLRNEIRATRAAVRARGDTDLKLADYDGMPYLNAFIKEVLRHHPILFHAYRMATRDDVLPLTKPIRTTTGKVLNDLPIPKGTVLVVSIAACNRDKTFWGEDAQEFKPERFLNEQSKKGQSFTIYGNLFSFGGGPRACLGYKFALMEMQTIIFELVNNFEFGMTEESKNVKRKAAMVMVAAVKGQEEKGVQMPLKIKFAPPEVDF